MPYITEKRREEIDCDGSQPRSSGELNYAITSVIRSYIHAHGNCYTIINEILGALEGAKAEFYRRIAAPYEDQKIKENGDVY